MKTEQVEKRFGIIAVEMGFITAEQLVEVLKIQVMEDIEHEEHRLIGTILLDQGFIAPPQIEEVVKALMQKSQKSPGVAS